MLEGSFVRATAEIVIGEIPGRMFDRAVDPRTSYAEIVLEAPDRSARLETPAEICDTAGSLRINLREAVMAKGRDAKKTEKKPAQKTPKEKKAEKQAKKSQKD